MKRIGEPPLRGTRYTARPGAYAILPLNGKVLLTLQGGAEEPLQLPGGGIDPGETAITALHREVFEETGWSLAHPVLFGRFRRFVYMPEYDLMAEKLCRVFVARPVRRKQPPSEPGHSAHWLGYADALDQLDNPGDRVMFHRYLRQL